MNTINFIAGFFILGLALSTIGALLRGWRWYAYLPVLIFLLYTVLWVVTFGAVFGTILPSEALVFIAGIANSLFALMAIIFSFKIIGLKQSESNKVQIFTTFQKIIAPINKQGVLLFYLFTVSIWIIFCFVSGLLRIGISGKTFNFLFIPSAIISFLLLRFIHPERRRKSVITEKFLSAPSDSKMLLSGYRIQIAVILCGCAGMASGYLISMIGNNDGGYYVFPGLLFGIAFSSIIIDGFMKKLVFTLLSILINAVATFIVTFLTGDYDFPNPIFGLLSGILGAVALCELLYETTEMKRDFLKFLNSGIAGGLLGILFIILLNSLSTGQTAVGYALWQSMVALSLLADNFPIGLYKIVAKKR